MAPIKRYTKLQRQQATWLSIGTVGIVCSCMYLGYLIKDQKDQYTAVKKVRSLTLEQQIEILEDQKYLLNEKKRMLELKMEQHFREVEERKIRQAEEARKAEIDRMRWEAARMRYGARMRGKVDEEQALKKQHDEIMAKFVAQEEQEKKELAKLKEVAEKQVAEKLAAEKAAMAK